MILFPQTRQRNSGPVGFLTNKIKGLNLVSPAALLSSDEVIDALNLKLNDAGELETREGLKKCSSVAMDASAAIKHIAPNIPVGADSFTFAVDANHKLYKYTGVEPNMDPGAELGTLEGAATIEAFNGIGAVFDGGYIKETNGTTLTMAYNNGNQAASYNFSGLCRSRDATISLYSGVTTRVGSKFTTQTWTAGYTIPLTTVECWISKVGSPAGDILVNLYDSTGANLLDSMSTTVTEMRVTENPRQLSFAFDSASYYGMAPGTQYVVAVVFGGGDASNYIRVHHATVASGGDLWYYDGSWHSVSTKSTCIGVKAGKPPKGSFGKVKDLRMFVGGDPDNLGYQWFSNINSLHDWSTSTPILSTNERGFEGAGFISAIDDNANSYPVGGIMPLYNDLYVFGKAKQPFLSKLTGATPYDWKLPPLGQYVYTDHKTLIGLPCDIWFASEQGIHKLSGVQEYGDIRTFSPGDPIGSVLTDNFDTDAFAGYNPGTGQYLIKLTGYTNILVCHVAQPIIGKYGYRYIWTFYKFKNLTPSAFASSDNKFYVGCTNGHLYRLDKTLVKDAGTLPDVQLKTGILCFPFNSSNIRELFLGIISTASATGTLSFYKNGNGTAFWNDSLTIGTTPVQQRPNFSCNSLQLYLHTLVYTKPVIIKDLIFQASSMGSR